MPFGEELPGHANIHTLKCIFLFRQKQDFWTAGIVAQKTKGAPAEIIWERAIVLDALEKPTCGDNRNRSLNGRCQWWTHRASTDQRGLLPDNHSGQESYLQ